MKTTAIPDELKGFPHWVAWKTEIRDGKPTKIPKDAKNGMNASSTNSATWADFPTAVFGAKRFGCDGVGFVFSDDDPFSGVDLDDCRNPDTGEVAGWAQGIIDRFQSYPEVSPSRTGVKVFVKGKLTTTGKKKAFQTGAVECYSRGRFFTVTGDHVAGAATTIEPRQAELDALVKEVFGQSRFEEEKEEAPGIYRNWDELHSEARRRIASHPSSNKRPDGWIHSRGVCHDGKSNSALALNPATGKYHCQAGCENSVILKALGLPERPNVNGHCKDETPWSQKAVDPGGDDHAQQEQLPIARPWVDIKTQANDESVLIGPGRWLTQGSGCFIVGPTGAGKSTLCATLTHSFGLGRQALGLVPTRPLMSLVVQAEDDDGDLVDMKAGILSHLNPNTEELEILRKSVLIVTERAKTGVPFLASVLQPLLEKHRPDLLWLNPLSAYFGSDLNDQQAVALFFRNTLNPILAAAKCAAFVVHHCAKPSKERKDWAGAELAYLGSGSGDLANWSRETVALRHTASPGIFEMSCTKRWRKLSWVDASGQPTGTRLIAHGSHGSMVWRDANAETLKELGVEQYSDTGLLRLVPAEGIDKADLVEEVAKVFSVAARTAERYVSGACKAQKRQQADGTTAKVVLLSIVKRDRREIYPDSSGGRKVVWLKRVC